VFDHATHVFGNSLPAIDIVVCIYQDLHVRFSVQFGIC